MGDTEVTKLYLSNMPPAMTEEQIRDLFSDLGELSEIDILETTSPEGLPTNAAYMVVDEAFISSAKERFNGYELMGRRLAICPASPPKSMEPPSDQEKEVAERIAEQLQETDANAKRQILDVVRFCGAPFAEKLLEEAARVEEAGGLLIPGTEQRRTIGGVFFKLVKDRMSSKIRWFIFRPPERKKEKSKDQPQGDQQAAPKKEKQAKQPKQEKAAKKQSPAAPPPAPIVPPPPPEPAISLEDAQQKLAELQPALQEAQAHLAALKAGPAAKQAGLFSAMKQVVEIQREIDSLLKVHPSLR